MANQQKNIIFRAFSEYALCPAIITPDTQLTFHQFNNASTTTAKKLQTIQLKKDEPVAILCEANMEYLIVLLALWKSGIIAVPLNTRWPTELIRKSLHSIKCNKIITLEKNTLQADNKFNIFYLTQLVTLNHNNDITNPDIFTFDTTRAASIIFTSGSTGEPKAVLHSFGNHYYNAMGSNKNIPFVASDRWLLTLPLYHVGGLSILFRSLIGGGEIAVPDPQKSLTENISDMNITHISLVATQLCRLLMDKKAIEQLKSLKAILLGGSAMPEQFIKKAVDMNVPVYTSYGSTEMASQITTTQTGDTVDRLTTSGKLLPYRELKIASDGEIKVKGLNLFKGYVKDKKIIRPFDKEGWFATGDLGFMDEKGSLTVTGRKDNMFISGGENIQPEEIEKQLNNITGIEQSLVVPVYNVEFGQRPVAFIKNKNGNPDTDLIKKQLEKFLPKFKVPDHFFPWPQEKRSDIKPDRNFFIKLAGKLLNSTKPG